jgi:signal transduction histidine kinase
VTETVRPIVPQAENPSEPEEGSADRAPSTLALLMSWRDWNIPTKLAAVTLVPIVFAIVLGAMQIADQVDRAESYRRVDRLVTVNEQLRPLVNALQQERTATTALLAGRAGAEVLARELADKQRNVDSGRDALLRAAHRATFHNEITSSRFTEVDTRLAELPAIRVAVAAGGLDAPATLGKFNTVIGALLNFDRAAAAEAIDPALAGTAIALHDLGMAQEEIRYQQALVGVGLARGGLSEAELAELRASQSRLSDRSAEFRLDADPAQQKDFQRLVAGPGVETRERLAMAAMSTAAGRPLQIDGADWNLSSEYTAGRTGAMSALLGNQLGDRSTALQNEASDGAGLASVILLIALVVAGAVMLVVGRHLLRSLNLLRRSALDVAEHKLPEAVERIRDGAEHHEPIVEPVPVRSADEVGQVARAFDAVHRQALRLATEQASLRAHYGDVFVNLSRRSQGLVQRQLQLLERLERDEEDAEQLDTLFQLDHLATRMRRNNENLMVLSGSELGRRNQRPATLADLLRAAVSEIEQYQRVVMLPPPAVLIVGYAVGDLVRLVAELLDNAAAFSAPSTQVTIASHSFEDGSVCIAVLDEGIGMSESELADANSKLANVHTVDVSTSRRMGLFVVGRLASRHQVEVSLHGGKNIPGVRATVTVPAELVTVNPAEARTELMGASAATSTSARVHPVTHEPPSTNGHGPVNGSANGTATTNGHVSGWKPSPLPRRAKPANDPSTPDITQRLAGDDAPPPKKPEEPDTGEKTPLPRRSPGASQFAQPVDTDAGPVDLAVPEGAGPPAGSLFTPGGNWWESDHNGRSAVEETTPIFDEMVSAWFRELTDRPDSQWEFKSDAGFHTAQTVSQSQPDSYTDSGLPKRHPRQNLVPGSAETGDGEPVAAQDPEELRKRLSQYQQGVSRARDSRLVADDASAEAGPPTMDLSAAGWRFVPGPPDFTSGGLPRRTPRPEPAGGDGAAVPANRAAELRGRLGNLQAGLTRGRQSLAERAHGHESTEVGLGAQAKQEKHQRESE